MSDKSEMVVRGHKYSFDRGMFNQYTELKCGTGTIRVDQETLEGLVDQNIVYFKNKIRPEFVDHAKKAAGKSSLIGGLVLNRNELRAMIAQIGTIYKYCIRTGPSADTFRDEQSAINYVNELLRGGFIEGVDFTRDGATVTVKIPVYFNSEKSAAEGFGRYIHGLKDLTINSR